MRFFVPTHGQAEADVAAFKKATAELDRLLAARAVDIEDVVAEFKAARKASQAAKSRARKPAKSV